MQVRYSGNVRVRIEGYGYVKPGETIVVAGGLGKPLCRGSEFREIKDKVVKHVPEAVQSSPAKAESRRQNAEVKKVTRKNITNTDTDVNRLYLLKQRAPVLTGRLCIRQEPMRSRYYHAG